ncbi:3-hydroxyisobutyrate dehydrogenase [Desulfomarina profundi]|uniref:3-hydroxyisobutyrate dehydrogenase n=1 Tax=Desulfomarina profundi TaxID=2772557 RepID=A0A8D5FYJ9_9BACT|nr:NAD(P)-dependent oxidoreductase [Desulfomarina profundi]BCL62327.1 3-hydroxyisobutyrate dehydrogenase [Desulfomarina profundi]
MTVLKGTEIGFIGIGVMGKGMVRNLLRDGWKVHVYSRTKAKAKELLKEGGVWEESVAVLAARCSVIFSMVGFPKDVEEIYLADDGILNNAASGSYVIDMTTSQPQLAEKIAGMAEKKNIFSLDAPVSGGDIGARNGTLSIMVGGDCNAYEHILPLFQLMGKNIIYQGGAGAGQHTKMCNQIAIAAGMLGVCEALAYAERSGLDQRTVLASIESGAAGSWSLSNLGPRIMKGDFSPGFYVKHFIKDMTIALESAVAMGLDMPGLVKAKELYEKLAAMGCDEDGTQALYKMYRREDDC